MAREAPATHRPSARWLELLRAHLRCVPAFRALIRTIECRLVSEAGPLDAPVLDVGCGDGLFAHFAFDRPLAAGIDRDRTALRLATRQGAHRLAVQARAEALPWADAAFASVLANCALEHVDDLDAALAEIRRVLRPGGRFVFGVPAPTFGPYLAGARAARALGWTSGALAYARWFHRHSAHHHVHDDAAWRARLHRHGFEVERTRPYMSPRAHAVFDLAHYASVPRLVRWKLRGRWVGRPDGPVNAWWWRRLGPFISEDPEVGAYVFIEARAAGSRHDRSPSSRSPSGVSAAVS